MLMSTVLVMILLTTFIGCGTQHPSAFVGRWSEEEGTKSMELLKDGTGIADDTKEITWKMEGSRFYLTIPSMGFVMAYNYKISGSTLTLTDDSGNTKMFKKQKK